MIVRKENITVGRLKTPRLCQNESGGVDFDQDVVMVEVAERSKRNSIRLSQELEFLALCEP